MNKLIYIEPNSERWLNLEDLPNEIWKDIQDYEGLYQISNYGRVKSLERNTTHARILKCYYNKRDCCRISLYKNKIKHNYFVHSLVLIMFTENKYEQDLQINHKNENKKCNMLYNLEWCTNKYNINYGTGVTRSKEKKYKKVEQYTLDNVFIKQYKSIQDASIMTSIKHNKSGVRAISKCARGIIKSYRGFKWKFVSNDSEMMHNG